MHLYVKFKYNKIIIRNNEFIQLKIHIFDRYRLINYLFCVI